MYRRGWGWRRRPLFGFGAFPGCGCLFVALALLGMCALFSTGFFRVPFFFYR